MGKSQSNILLLSITTHESYSFFHISHPPSTTYSTYVYFWVKKQVNEAAHTYTKSTFVSQHDDRQATKMRQAQDEHMRVAGEQLTSSELAAKLNITVSRVKELERRSRPYLSMEGTYIDGHVLYIDSIRDQSNEKLDESMYLNQVEDAVTNALSKLSEEERLVLGHRLGLVDGVPRSWDELSSLMEGCSISYLRKVEARAKTHLRRNVEVVKLIHGAKRLSSSTLPFVEEEEGVF